MFATEITDDSLNIIGLTLNFASSSNTCPSDPTRKFSLKVDVVCSESSTLEFQEFGGDSCDMVLKYASKSGCPVFSYDKFMMFINKYYYLWGAALIAAGVFVAFFGNNLVNGVIMLVSSILVWLLASYGIFWILDKTGTNTSDTVNWVILGACAIVGGVVGYVLMKTRKFGIAVLSAWGGVLIGLLLTSMILVESRVTYYLIILGCAIVTFGFAIKFEKIVIMLMTSLTGSYMIIRGISLYAGGFPSEAEISQEIASGVLDWDPFPKTFYAYLAGVIVLTMGSYYYQKTHDKDDKKRSRS